MDHGLLQAKLKTFIDFLCESTNQNAV